MICWQKLWVNKVSPSCLVDPFIFFLKKVPDLMVGHIKLIKGSQLGFSCCFS
jgi:hypothetical protein